MKLLTFYWLILIRSSLTDYNMGACSFKPRRVYPNRIVECRSDIRLKLTGPLRNKRLRKNLEDHRLIYLIKDSNTPILSISSSDLYLRRKKPKSSLGNLDE